MFKEKSTGFSLGREPREMATASGNSAAVRATRNWEAKATTR